MSSIRLKAAQGIHVGDTFFATRTFTEDDVIRFATISKDYNPVHFDDRFAGVKNLKGRVCHGLLVASLATEIGGQAGWLAREMSFTFLKPVYFGDTVTCEMTITAITDTGTIEADAVYRNHDGTLVLKGHLIGMPAGEPEREVLKMMLEEGDPTNGLTNEI